MMKSRKKFMKGIVGAVILLSPSWIINTPTTLAQNEFQNTQVQTTTSSEAKQEYDYTIESIKLDEKYILSGDQTKVISGQSIPIEITLRNTGSLNWINSPPLADSDNIFVYFKPENTISNKLFDSTWYSQTSVATISEIRVSPGSTGTIKSFLRVPLTSDKIEERFTLFSSAAKKNQLLSEVHLNLEISTPEYSYEIVNTTTLPNDLTAGEIKKIKFVLKNTGNVRWQKHFGTPSIKLIKIKSTVLEEMASADFINGEWDNLNRVADLSENEVKPGQAGTFEFYLNAPFKGGPLVEYYFPVIDYISWMEGKPLKVETNIIEPTFDYKIDDQLKSEDGGVSLSLKPGEIKDYWIKLQNTSNFTWRKDNPKETGNVYLSIVCNKEVDSICDEQSPQKKSMFYDADTWIDASKIGSFQEEEVKPGDSGTFIFKVKAPDISIPEKQYVGVLIDSVKWMPNYNIYFEPTVGNLDSDLDVIISNSENTSIFDEITYATSNELNLNGRKISIPVNVGKIGREQHLATDENEVSLLRQAGDLYDRWRVSLRGRDTQEQSRLKQQWQDKVNEVTQLHYSKTGTQSNSQNGIAGAEYGSIGKGAFYPPSSPQTEQYYINMRWPYVGWRFDGTSEIIDSLAFANRGSYKEVKVLVTNRRTGKRVVVAVLDSGPAPWAGTCYFNDGTPNKNMCPGISDERFGSLKKYGVTGSKSLYNENIPVVDENNNGVEDQSSFLSGSRAPRVGGLSPEAFSSLDANNDDIVQIGFLLDQNLPLGPLN